MRPASGPAARARSHIRVPLRAAGLQVRRPAPRDGQGPGRTTPSQLLQLSRSNKTQPVAAVAPVADQAYATALQDGGHASGEAKEAGRVTVYVIACCTCCTWCICCGCCACCACCFTALVSRPTRRQEGRRSCCTGSSTGSGPVAPVQVAWPCCIF